MSQQRETVMEAALLNITRAELETLKSELPYIAPDNVLLRNKIESLINLLNI